ncbi:ABC transporter permease [Microbacterium sp. Marseille-Q6648]|jgi:peptide/nickel transport system permease protein|uniref:ABC transporter permease n=1 Tax=Microbacterium sp. Marseille-Q6648 TaxID=2937991 RepID=UPI00204225A6|nr:ABC transporter permease [Microbacterium sp. Marseille-Q6648]
MTTTEKALEAVDPIRDVESRKWMPRWRLPAAWRRPLAILGIVIIAFWVLVILFGPLLSPYDPLAQDSARFLPPSLAHPFGTDGVGRDVLSRVIHGARISIPIAVMLVALSLLIGATVGAIAGYFGGLVDAVLMRIVDLFFAFPAIILAMAVSAALGPSLVNAVLAIVVVSWPAYARVTRSLVLGLRDSNFIAASRLIGASSFTTLRRDIAPNILGPIAVICTLELGNAILLLSGLSYLGLGAVPPTPEWGAMVSEGSRVFYNYWVALFPGVAILSVVLAFNFIGDSLRDALDPRTSRAVQAMEL